MTPETKKKIEFFRDKILEIENNFDENDFTIDKLNFWPLIRLYFFQNVGSSNINKKKKLKLSLIKYLFLRWKNISSKIIYSFFFYQKIKMYSGKKVDDIFFSDKKFYYNRYQGKYFNNLIDPYYHYHLPQKKIKIEIIDSIHTYPKKIFEPVYINLFSVAFFEYILFKLNIIFNGKRKKNFFIKLKKIEKNYLIKLNKETLYEQFIDIYCRSKCFEKIFKIIKPKKVYLTAYYSMENFAISFACSKLGIKCIDIQHGGIENYHLMYSNWNYKNINKNNLLPNHFIIWDKRQLSQKTLPNKNLKNFSVTGKLSIKFWKEFKNKSDDYSNTITQNFLNSLKKYDKIILVCLTVDLPTQIIDLIKSSSKKYFWLIRAHPRHSKINSLEKKFLYSTLKSINFDLKFSSTIDINFLLEISDIFITDYSSTIYDADYFKIPKLSLQSKNDLFKSWQLKGFCTFNSNIKFIKAFLKKKN